MQFRPDAEKIKRWREERLWSQEHLADLAGLGLRTVQRIENGDPASRDSVMALAAAFNVDVTALSVDAEAEARHATERQAEEAEARMRLYFYLHAASVAMVTAIFGFLAVIDGSWEIFKITLWFAFPLAVHGIAVFAMQMMDRHERKFGTGDHS